MNFFSTKKPFPKSFQSKLRNPRNFFYLSSLKHYWDKSRNTLKIDENERVHFNTLQNLKIEFFFPQNFQYHVDICFRHFWPSFWSNLSVFHEKMRINYKTIKKIFFFSKKNLFIFFFLNFLFFDIFSHFSGGKKK